MPRLRTCDRCHRVHPVGKPCPLRPSRPWDRGSTRAWRKLRLVILERDGWLCQVRLVCDGAPATDVDHIVTRAEGGTDDPANLRASCEPCNIARNQGGGHDVAARE